MPLIGSNAMRPHPVTSTSASHRTAHDTDARVIFRTAGADSPLPKKLPPSLLGQWHYLEAESRGLHARDRSSIYGGFHVYTRHNPV